MSCHIYLYSALFRTDSKQLHSNEHENYSFLDYFINGFKVLLNRQKERIKGTDEQKKLKNKQTTKQMDCLSYEYS